MRILDDKALEDVITAINMRINKIETGDTSLSAADAHERNSRLDINNRDDRRCWIKINELSADQKAVVERLNSARTKLQNSLRERAAKR